MSVNVRVSAVSGFDLVTSPMPASRIAVTMFVHSFLPPLRIGSLHLALNLSQVSSIGGSSLNSIAVLIAPFAGLI